MTVLISVVRLWCCNCQTISSQYAMDVQLREICTRIFMPSTLVHVRVTSELDKTAWFSASVALLEYNKSDYFLELPEGILV